MPAVQRVGDANGAGGLAKGGVASVRVNGQAVIVNGDSVSNHAPWTPTRVHIPHAAATVGGGSGSVRAGGTPIVYTGCADSCGHARAGGSDNVRVSP
jgi:uncharacterized Zn-binding protein involved in type VI secretion